MLLWQQPLTNLAILFLKTNLSFVSTLCGVNICFIGTQRPLYPVDPTLAVGTKTFTSCNIHWSFGTWPFGCAEAFRSKRTVEEPLWYVKTSRQTSDQLITVCNDSLSKYEPVDVPIKNNDYSFIIHVTAQFGTLHRQCVFLCVSLCYRVCVVLTIQSMAAHCSDSHPVPLIM